MSGPTPESAWVVRGKLLIGEKPKSRGAARAIASSAPAMISINDDEYEPAIAGSFRDSRHYDLGTLDDVLRCVREARTFIDKEGALYVFGTGPFVVVAALLAASLGAAKTAKQATELVTGAWSQRLVRGDRSLPFAEARRKQVEELFTKL